MSGSKSNRAAETFFDQIFQFFKLSEQEAPQKIFDRGAIMLEQDIPHKGPYFNKFLNYDQTFKGYQIEHLFCSDDSTPSTFSKEW